MNGNAGGSNPPQVGSTPTPPAIYIDDATGRQVDDDWWPEPLVHNFVVIENASP